MKLFKALTVLFCTSILSCLQAMAMKPDYGQLKVKPKPVSALVRSAPILQLAKESSCEQSEERIFLTDEELDALFKVQKEAKNFKAFVQQNQFNNKEAHNENSDSDFDNDEEEAARFAEAYARIKAVTLENKNNLKLMTIFIGSKQQHLTERSITQKQPQKNKNLSNILSEDDENNSFNESENDDMFFPLE